MTSLRRTGFRCSLILQAGRLDDLVILDGGQRVAPLYRAPWFGGPVPPGTARHLAMLAGDFFCAPFAAMMADRAFTAGRRTATGAWIRHRRPAVRHARHPVRGARVTKELALQDGHPFVYQTHRFHGGAGALPVANHAMIHLPQGGIIRTSAKAGWETGPAPQESDPACARPSPCAPPPAAPIRAPFPGRMGGTADLTATPGPTGPRISAWGSRRRATVWAGRPWSGWPGRPLTCRCGMHAPCR